MPASNRSSATLGIRWCGSTTERRRWRSGGPSPSRSGPRGVGPPGRGRDSNSASRPIFPRKDEHGRVVNLAEFEVVGLLGVLVSLILLAIVDGLLALIGLSRF